MRQGKLLIILTGVVLGFFACSGEPNTFSRGQMLQDTADEVAMPLHETAAEQSSELKSNIDSFCSDPSESTLSSARDSWKKVNKSLKKLESWSFGPHRNEFAILMEVDKWPVYTNQVNQAINNMDSQQEPATYVEVLDYTRHLKGIPAIGYLLWSSGDAESVPARFQNDNSGKRCSYLKGLATYANSRVTGLKDSWSPEGENYFDEFAEAGAGSEAFRTKQAAINKFVNTLVFVSEEMTEKMRLGGPLGKEDGGEIDVESLESQFSETSKAQVIASLKGIKEAYSGADGKSLSDYTNFKKPAVDQEVKNALDGAIEAVENIPGSLKEALSSDKAAVEEAHEAVGKLSRVLSTELRTILGVKKTNIVADND